MDQEKNDETTQGLENYIRILEWLAFIGWAIVVIMAFS